MGLPPDEHLPEVVPDTSPQVVSGIESQYKQRSNDDHHDKYIVQYDDTPKIPSDMAPYGPGQGPPGLVPGQGGQHPAYAQGQYAVSTASPDGSLPWEPLSAIEETQAGHGGGGMGGGMDGTGFEGGDSEKPRDERRICGLRRKVFFIAFLVLLVVISIAIGGGVGGGLARQGSSRHGSGTSSTATATSSSTTATPTYLNNQTDFYDFAFQGYPEPDFGGEPTDLIKEEGFFDLGMDCKSYVWKPNNTGCCITFCADEKEPTGWLCDPRKRDKAEVPFPRLYVWCGRDRNNNTEKDTCSRPKPKVLF